MKPLYSCIGGSAEGVNCFFERKPIIQKIRRKLKQSENLLIAAPRRIGKTSILKHIRDTPEDNQIIVYLIVQSVASIDEFNKTLFKTLIKNTNIFNGLGGYIKRSTTTVRHSINKITGIKLEGIEIDHEDRVDYYDELNKLFEDLQFNGKQIIIFIDEFPDAISNIIERDQAEATKLLQQQRELRTQYKSSQIQFVYTGSTGLHNVVKKLDKIHLVNDLLTINIPPLSKDEAKKMIQRLVFGKQLELETFELSSEVIDYTIDEINWLLPYFIQIIIDKLYDDHELYEIKETISNKTIDSLFSNIIKTHSVYSDYFDHWETRLKYIGKENHALAIETLNFTSKQGEISYEEFHNLAVKHYHDNPRYVLEVLQYDGYLSENAGGDWYGFNSPLLRQWWANNVAR